LLRRKRGVMSGNPRTEKFFSSTLGRINFDAMQKCR
jgi:hypothetical protein